MIYANVYSSYNARDVTRSTNINHSTDLG